MRQILFVFIFSSSFFSSFSQEYIKDDVERVKSFPKKMVYYMHECPLVNGKGWSSAYFLNKLGKVDSTKNYSRGKLMGTFKYFYNDKELLIEQNQISPRWTNYKQYNYYYQYDYDEKGRVKIERMFEDSFYKRLISVKDRFRYDLNGHVISLNSIYPDSSLNNSPSEVLYGYNELGQKIYKILPGNGDSSIYRYLYDRNGFVDSVYQELQNTVPSKARNSDHYFDIPVVKKASFRLSYKTDRKGNWVKCYAHINGKKYLYIVRKIYYRSRKKP